MPRRPSLILRAIWLLGGTLAILAGLYLFVCCYAFASMVDPRLPAADANLEIARRLFLSETVCIVLVGVALIAAGTYVWWRCLATPFQMPFAGRNGTLLQIVAVLLLLLLAIVMVWHG